MRFDIICGVPEILTSCFSESIIKRAQERSLVEIFVHNLHDYSNDKHCKIDDIPYSGEAGMVLKPEPIYNCISHLEKERKYDEIIFLSPDGKVFNQKIATELSLKKNIILLCGHYKGIDERVRQSLVTCEISIGDYVLTGGELAAAVVVDATVRLIPGVVGDAESLLTDSFQDNLLCASSYTRPSEFMSMKVPEILLSGNHKEIRKYRLLERIEKTKKLRKDLYEKFLNKNKDE